MSTVSFSYQSGDQNYQLIASFAKKIKTGGMHKSELEGLVKKAASAFIVKHGPDALKGIIEVKLGGDLTSAKVRCVHKKWETISLKEVAEDTKELKRTMLPSVQLEELSASTTPLGRALHVVVGKLIGFFCFITRHTQKPPVDVALLQEVIGTFPKEGSVSIRQALSFWIRSLKREELPSTETNKLLLRLQQCEKTSHRMEQVASLKGKARERAFNAISREMAQAVDGLKEQEKILIPTGFWKGAHPSEVFQDCLLEVSKGKEEPYTVSLFSIEEASFEKSHSLITTYTIEKNELLHKIPLLLAMPIALKEEQECVGVSGLFSAIKHIKGGGDLLSLLAKEKVFSAPSHEEVADLFVDEKKVMPEEPEGRPSQYVSASRVVKTYLRHEMRPKSEEEYKIFRVRSELGLLYRATATKSWLQDSEYRDVVVHTAHKLLSDIAGVKGERSLPSTLTGTGKPVRQETFEEETKNLLLLLDEASSYAESQVKKSTRESLQPTSFGKVQLPHLFIPKKIGFISKAETVGVDLRPVTLSRPVKTVAEVCTYLKGASEFCESLVKTGRYDLLESSIPVMYSQLSLYNEAGDPFFQNVTLEQAKMLSQSIATIQKSVYACHLANVQHFFHPNFLLATPFFEVMHDQVIVEAARTSCPEQKIPTFINSKILDQFFFASVSSFRSQDSLRCLNEAKRYSDSRKEDLGEIFSVRMFKNNTEKATTNAVFALVVAAQRAAILGVLSLPDTIQYSDPFSSFTDGLRDKVICAVINVAKVNDIEYADGHIREYTRGLNQKEKEEYVRTARLNERNRRRKDFKKTSIMSLQGSPFSTLPDVELQAHPITGNFPTVIEEFFIPKVGLVVEPDYIPYDRWSPEISESNRAYSPITPGTMKVKKSQTPSDQRLHAGSGLDCALYHFADGEGSHYYPLDQASINEFYLLTKNFEARGDIAPLSQDEVRAIQALSPPPNEPGAERMAIASLLSLASYHPRLLSCPQVRVFIERTIFRPGVISGEKGFAPELDLLRERINALKIDAHKLGSIETEICLTSLLGVISARMPKDEKKVLSTTDWIGELKKLETAASSTPTVHRLYAQEYLGLVVASKNVQDSSVLSAWLQLHREAGQFASDHPGVHEEARELVISLLSKMASMEKSEKERILNDAVLSLKIPVGSSWDLTNFPSCRNGRYTLELDKGLVWKDGKLPSKLSSDIEKSSLFQKMGLPEKARWNVVRSFDQESKAPLIVYTHEGLPDIRVTVAGDGGRFSIQKKVEGKWYAAAEPTLEEKPVQNPEEELHKRLERRFGKGYKLLKRLVSKPEEKEKVFRENTVVLSRPLFALARGDLVFIEDSSSPSEMIAGEMKIRFSREGVVESVSSQETRYEGLGVEGRDLFSALDDRIVASEKLFQRRKVHFPCVRLSGSKKAQGLTATRSHSSWEYDDELLAGYTLVGRQQPKGASAESGALPIIPLGISSYQLLQNSEGAQKVLIPLTGLKPVFEGHIPGQEEKTRKQFARFVTQVTRKTEDDPVKPTTVLCFDVVDGALATKDPVCAAYLALLYATQQRYEDAVRYLEASHTNLPTAELKQLYVSILEWKDSSPECEALKNKACLLTIEWPSVQDEKVLPKDKIAKKVLAPFLQEESEKWSQRYNTLDRKDKIRLLQVVEWWKAHPQLAPDEPQVQQPPPFVEPSLEMDASATFSVIAEKLCSSFVPEETLFPLSFYTELALHPDETITKYFLPLCNTREKCRDILRQAQTRMSNQGKMLLKVLLTVEPAVIKEITSLLEGYSKKSKWGRENVSRDVKAKLEEAYKLVPQTDTSGGITPPPPPPAQKPSNTPPERLLQLNAFFGRVRNDEQVRQVEGPLLPMKKKDVHVQQSPPAKGGESIFGGRPFERFLEKIGASPLLPRTGAFFDEVGKGSQTRLLNKIDALKKDTEAYLRDEEGGAIFDSSKATEVCQRLLQMRKTLEDRQQALRKKIFVSVNERSEVELERVKEALTPARRYIHFERLLGGYVQDDLEGLLKRYDVKGVEVKVLEKDIQKYLETSIKFKQVQDTLGKIPTRKTSFSEDERREIGAMLEAKRFFAVDGSSSSRLHLMLEYSCGFLLRKGNLSLVSRLLGEKSCICQLPPGSGKTLVVLRLLSILRAKGCVGGCNGENLSALILPEWLYEQNRKDLDRGLKELFDQDIFCLDVPETRDFSAVELDDILSHIQSTIINKGVLLTTRQSLLTLKDSFEHLGRQIAKESKAEHQEKAEELMGSYTRMAKLITLLHTRMQALTDEVDSILDIHREVNRKEGDGELLAPWQRDTGAELYSCLLSEKDKETELGKLARGVLSNTHVDLPSNVHKRGLEQLAGIFLAHLKITEKKEVCKAYLLQKPLPPSEQIPSLPEGIEPGTREKLVAAKSFLSQALPLSTLTKANNTKDGYGRYGSQVIPYAGPGQPDVHSEFCNPFEIIAFTIQDYIQKGISREQAQVLIESLLDARNKEVLGKPEVGGKGLESYKEACSSYGIDVDAYIEEYAKDEDRAIQHIVDCVNGTPDRRLRFCQQYVLPKIKVTAEQVRADAFDLVDMTNLFSGMTGTPYNVRTYHDDVSKEGAVTEGSDGKTLAALMKHQEEIQVSTIELQEGETISQYLTGRGTKKYEGIIDIGAYCKEKAPEALARDMAVGLPEETQYIVYVNRKGEIVAYDRKTDKEVPFDEKKIPLEKRKTIYQVFIGTDIKQKGKAKFLVTVGNLNFLKDFIQGVMRLRGLHQEQTFDIVLSSDVEKTIRDSMSDKTQYISLQDVLRYCVKNEMESAESDTLAAEKRKIERVPRAAIFRGLVAMAAGAGPERAADIAAVQEELREIISKKQTYLLADLDHVQRNEKTQKTLQELKERTLKILGQLLEKPIVQRNAELKAELVKAVTALDKRKPTDPQYMPEDNLVRPGGEGIGQTATAFEQQQTTQLAEAISYERRTTSPSGMVPYWRRFIFPPRSPKPLTKEGEGLRYQQTPTEVVAGVRLKTPVDDENASFFDTEVMVSINIFDGWLDGFFKDVSFAAFDTKEGLFTVLDRTDFRQLLEAKEKKGLASTVPCLIGPESYPLGEIPEKSREIYYRRLVQAKLKAGLVDFASEGEKKALLEFVREKGVEAVTKFMEANRKEYLAETSYERFVKGKCTLREICDKVAPQIPKQVAGA